MDYMSIRKELIKTAKELNAPIDWSNTRSLKYYIYYDFKKNRLDITYTRTQKSADIYFSTPEIAQRAINNIGALELVTNYFNIDLNN